MSSSSDVPAWMKGMTPVERAAAEEHIREVVAAAPPIRPEAIKLLQSLGFPFNRKKRAHSAVVSGEVDAEA